MVATGVALVAGAVVVVGVTVVAARSSRRYYSNAKVLLLNVPHRDQISRWSWPVWV